MVEYKQSETTVLKERLATAPGLRVERGVQSASQLGKLSESAFRCIQSAFGRPDFSRDDALSHVKGDYLILATEGERVVGFSSLIFGSPSRLLNNPQLPEDKGCYFAGAVVGEEYKGKGLYQQMNKIRIDIAIEDESTLVFTRTQNPLVETSITHTLEGQMRKGLIRHYDLTREFSPGCFGSMLTAEVPPKSPVRTIQSAHDRLDVSAGDAYVLMYKLVYPKKGVVFVA